MGPRARAPKDEPGARSQPVDSPLDVADKIRVYQRGGSALATVVDPNERTMSLHDSDGVRVLEEHGVLRHDALPGFELHLGTPFADALDLPT